MKKKFFCGITVSAIVAVAVFNVSLSSKSSNLSGVSLANVEALAEGDDGTKPPAKTICNPGEVPDRYLRTSGPNTATYTSNASGYITIGGVQYGGYMKNTSITVTVETFNCDGIANGSCCDQSKVGTKKV